MDATRCSLHCPWCGDPLIYSHKRLGFILYQPDGGGRRVQCAERGGRTCSPIIVILISLLLPNSKFLIPDSLPPIVAFDKDQDFNGGQECPPSVIFPSLRFFALSARVKSWFLDAGFWMLDAGSRPWLLFVFCAFCGYFFYFCWSVGEKRQATCHKEEMADRNVRPPLTLVPA